MSDNLPADIWRDIFLKLSVKSLICSTMVCKSWKSFILSPYFIYAHLSLSKNHSLLRRYDQHDKLDRYLSLEIVGWNGSFEIRDRPYPKVPFKSDTGNYVIVGSCDGMVCLTNDMQSVILWNPSVRNHVFLPPAITRPKGPHKVLLGFGVANHVYKVIRLVFCWNPPLNWCVPPKAEIFSLGTRRWRSVPEFDIKSWFTNSICRQVLLNGIVHWLGYEPNGRYHKYSILAFDIGDEVFGKVMLPDVLARSRASVAPDMSLYKIGGSLAVVKGDPFTLINSCDIWVMKEYGVKDSWTKLYKIDWVEKCKNEDILFEVVGFNNGEAILACHGPYAGPGSPDLFSYNLETKQAKDLETVGTPRLFYIDDYVESLLLVKGNSVPVVEEIGGILEELNIKKD